MKPLLVSFGIASSDAGTFCKLLDADVGGFVDQSKFVEWCFRLVARNVGALSCGPPTAIQVHGLRPHSDTNGGDLGLPGCLHPCSGPCCLCGHTA